MKPKPPTKHLSTEFHFDGGWSVNFVKVHGAGHSVTVELNVSDGDGTFEKLWTFPASSKNMPTQRNARNFCRRCLTHLLSLGNNS